MAAISTEAVESFNHLMELPQHELIDWLKRIDLLTKDMDCPNCVNIAMKWISRKTRLDKHVWICRKCQQTVNIRQGSYFQTFPKLSLHSLIRYMWQWCHNLTSMKQLRSLNITSSKATASSLNGSLTQVIFQTLVRHPIGVQGGVGKHAQIDESLFVKRKSNKGRLVNERWVLGILCQEYDPARPIFQEVPDRRRETLTGVIKTHLAPGTTICTDGWGAYNDLEDLYDHRVVNHSANWVDPVTGAHTNGIEGQWCHAKRFLKGKACTALNLQANLYVYMWVKWFAEPNESGCFVQLLQDISESYPV